MASPWQTVWAGCRRKMPRSGVCSARQPAAPPQTIRARFFRPDSVGTLRKRLFTARGSGPQAYWSGTLHPCVSLPGWRDSFGLSYQARFVRRIKYWIYTYNVVLHVL